MNNHDDSPTEVLIAGMAVADFVFRVRAIPTEAEKYRADSMEIVVGGPAANAAIAISRLGGRAVLSTRLGEDGVADAIQGNLEAEGVDCRIRRAGRSPLSAVAVDAAGERQVVNFRGEALAEEPEPLDGLMPDAVLVDMGWTRAALAGLALARSRGVPGVVDAEAPATGAVLQAASHMAFARRGLAEFTGIDDKEEALLAASRGLDAWICVTDDAAGVSYVAEDRMETVSAFPIVGGEMRTASCELAGTGCAAFSDHRDLLAADLCDAYLIAAPNDLHHPILVDVLETAKPILCEKPLCTTTRDAADIVRRAARRTAPLWVAMEYRYMPPVERLLEKVQAGEAGAPRMMTIREHRFPFLEKVGHWNRFNARTDGTLVEKCCHFWDLMRLGLGADPVRVYASAGRDVNHLDERYQGRRPDIIDNAFVVIDFEGGARGMLDLCMFAEGSYWQESIAVTGDLARIEARVPGPARFTASGEERAAEISVADRGRRTETRTEVDVDHRILRASDHHGATYFQHERFRRLAAAGSGEAEVSPTDGYWSVLMGEAAEESARTGVPVDLNGREP